MIMYTTHGENENIKKLPRFNFAKELSMVFSAHSDT